MGRRKSNNNQCSASKEDTTMSNHFRFEDAEEAVEESSNLDQSMCDIDESDDKTSADYYFDSYSHFGIFPIPNSKKFVPFFFFFCDSFVKHTSNSSFYYSRFVLFCFVCFILKLNNSFFFFFLFVCVCGCRNS